MNEAADRAVFRSLDHALQAHGIPDENRSLIRRFCAELDIVQYDDMGSYIKAVRSGGPALNIAYGWTNGFRSEAEGRSAAGDAAEIWMSQRGKGLWGVTHPINKIGHGGGGPTKPNRTFGFCPRCNLALSADGQCGYCS